MRLAAVYITARDGKQARAIGKTLVRERLAACANIIGGMHSIYFWEGRLCEGRETVLIVKTRAALLRRLVKRVRSLHSYAVPCIAAVTIAGGSRDFLDWVAKETSRVQPRGKRRRAGTITARP